MNALLAAGRWVFVLNLIDHLPRASAYGNALAQDDELAAAQMEDQPEQLDEDEGSVGPSFEDWTPELAVLYEIRDILGVIRSEAWTLAQQQAPEFEPLPRPEGALDRAMWDKHERDINELQHTLFPDQHQEGDS